MKKLVVGAVLIATLALSASARAMRIAPNPILIRVATADRVVIGKVGDIAEKTEAADMFKGDTRQLKIATVKVEEAVLGKKAKTVKVGFVAPVMPVGKAGGPFIRRPPAVALTRDQEAMLFLTRHPTKKDLYVIQAYFDVVNKTGNAGFGTERDEARRAAKLLANASKGLDSKDSKERLETATMLISRYRTAPAGKTQTAEVPADESKKILTSLAEADWKNTPPRNFMLNPQSLFFRLALTPKDGWTQPKDFTQLQPAAKKWLKDNAGTYKMQRFVRADDKKGGLDPEPE